MIKLAKEFEYQFKCLGENSAVPVKKELDNDKTITYKIKLLKALDLCQTHCRVLLIIYLSASL